MSIFTAARRGLNALTSNDSNLANLISEEKDIVNSYSMLKNSFASSTTYLTLWGMNEADDLKDISSRAELINKEFGLCFLELEDCHSRYREKLKEIQTLTDGIAVIKAKIKACKERLEKAIKNNKNAESIQAELGGLELQLREETATFENEKRKLLKEAMIIHYEGIIKFSQKARVIGEFGGHIAKQIPQINIKTGQNVPQYAGHDVTQHIIEDFEAELYDVSKRGLSSFRDYSIPQLLNLDSWQNGQQNPAASSKKSVNESDILWDSEIELSRVGTAVSAIAAEETYKPETESLKQEQPLMSAPTGWAAFASTEDHVSLNNSTPSNLSQGNIHQLPRDFAENPW